MTPDQEMKLVTAVARLTERADGQDRRIGHLEAQLEQIGTDVRTISNVITTAKGFKGALTLIFMILSGVAVTAWEVAKTFFMGNGH